MRTAGPGGGGAEEKRTEDGSWRGSCWRASRLGKSWWQLEAARVSEPGASRDPAAAWDPCGPTLEEEVRGGGIQESAAGRDPGVPSGVSGLLARVGRQERPGWRSRTPAAAGS